MLAVNTQVRACMCITNTSYRLGRINVLVEIFILRASLLTVCCMLTHTRTLGLALDAHIGQYGYSLLTQGSVPVPSPLEPQEGSSDSRALQSPPAKRRRRMKHIEH